MALVEDILFTDDIAIKDGDWDIGVSDPQHQEHILTAKPGHFYQWPTLGVGVDDDKLGPIDVQAEKQRIRQNFEADNYRVNTVEIRATADGKVTSIDAIRLK